MWRKREKRVVGNNFVLSMDIQTIDGEAGGTAMKSIYWQPRYGVMALTLIAVVLLAFIWVTPASSGNSSDNIIDGEFEVQEFLLPPDEFRGDQEGYRHMSAIINEESQELILFGGIAEIVSGWPPPTNRHVYTLDLTVPPDEQEWEYRNTDADVNMPWFTSARGFIEINNNYYLTCTDANEDTVYTFDPNTYEFELLSTSDKDEEFQASDCCAVGVTMSNSREGQENKEERIYIMGGRNDFMSPIPYVRYYSITYDMWEQVEDLNVARSHSGCATVEQNGEPLIYVIAGGKSVPDPDETEVYRSIEIYDVIKDEWTLYDDYFPEGEGRTRFGAVQNIHDKYLLLIGGDATCAGGWGVGCPADEPTTWVDIIDIKRNNTLISDDNLIPQLNIPRQTPATILGRMKGNNLQDKYILYVIGGRSFNGGGYSTLGSTEVLSFDGINVQNIVK